MNQEYLKGSFEYSTKEIIFAATPENIASFIWRYSLEQRVMISTLDNWIFLTALLANVDCPDKKYLNEKIMPVLEPLTHTFPFDATVETVSPKSVKGKRCPLPDWNCLYWAGYSDQRYQMIKDGSCLLPFSDGRRKLKVEVVVQNYQYGNNLAVSLVPWRGMTPGDEIWLTVNLDGQRQQDHAFLDINHQPQEVLNWLEVNNIAKPTGRSQRSGFCVYPEYAFNPDRLRELDPDGYERHLKFRAEPSKQKERDPNR